MRSVNNDVVKLFAQFVLLIGFPAIAVEPDRVLFLVLSQPDAYSSSLARQLRSGVLEQAENIDKKRFRPPVVLLSHESFPTPSAWTVLPVLPELVATHIGETRNYTWLFVCEDRTHVDLKRLLETLQDYDSNEELWVGHSLHDRDASIIHHFAFFEDPTHFKYPHMGAGIALTVPLVKSITRRLLRRHLQRESNSGGGSSAAEAAVATSSDFSIDGSHELALFVHANGRGPRLTHDRRFCAAKDATGTDEDRNLNLDDDDDDVIHHRRDACATYPRPFETCGPAVAQSEIYFAVKTCEKFHRERLPVVQRTWARRAANVKYFSEVEDPEIPTVGLGVANTEAGHCEKTMAIFSRILGEVKRGEAGSVRWIVLADDDTILSVSRVRELLSCYDDSRSAVIGERYGYNLQSEQGYNYITGGGGMALTVPALESVVSRCRCPSARSPDDMLLGLCLSRLGVVVTHSPYFHQARPVDYAPEYLASSRQVSFHKHWMIDPVAVYDEWFSKADLEEELAANEEIDNAATRAVRKNVNNKSAKKMAKSVVDRHVEL